MTRVIAVPLPKTTHNIHSYLLGMGSMVAQEGILSYSYSYSYSWSSSSILFCSVRSIDNITFYYYQSILSRAPARPVPVTVTVTDYSTSNPANWLCTLTLPVVLAPFN